MKTKILILTLSLLITGLVNLSFSYDHVRYVDIGAVDDTNDGTTSALAWKNLFHAVNEINNDSTILAGETTVLYVAPGTYSAAMAIAGMNYISVSKNDLTIMGADSATTFLDGTGSDSAYWYDGVRVENGTSNFNISGITITNFTGAGVRFNSGGGNSVNACELSGNGYGVYVYGDPTEASPPIHGNSIIGNNYGIFLYSYLAAVSPEIKGNSISANTVAGIHVATESGESNPVIRENSIFSNGKGVAVVVGTAPSSPQILSNRIYDNIYGIEFNSGGVLVSQPEIINNVIYQDTGTMTSGILLYAMVSGSFIDAKIYHNTIDGGTDNGILTEDMLGTITAEIKYNIITNFTGGGSSYGIFRVNTSTLDIDHVNVWNNATSNFFNCSATNSISADPQYAADYSLAVTSPCVDQVAAAAGDLVNYDIIGTSRPRQSNNAGANLHDIGAYEYPYKEYNFTMPGGTGLGTDYRLMTLPIQVGGSSLSTVLTTAYGAYDNEQWRAFVWDSSNLVYIELGEAGFDTLTYNTTSHAGRSFWLISRDGAFANDTITFEGVLTGNMHPAYIPLNTGWNMIAIPWPASTENPSIELGNIVVANDANKFWLTSANNTLTGQSVWDYNGTPGYTELTSPTDLLVPGKGYWIYVMSGPIDLIIPPDNGSHMTASKRVARKSVTSSESPPPPPGSHISADGGNGCFIDACFLFE